MKKEWPVLSYEKGKPTYETLQLFTQVVGKIKLSKMPWANHSWNITLHISPGGITTQNMPCKDKNFQIDFDLIVHELKISTSLGEEVKFSLKNLSVAGFYAKIVESLKELQIELHINTKPSEIANPIPFEQDETHKTYDEVQASAFHLALLRVNDVFTIFRSRFEGKSSPVQFFWGGFDLSLSFFSGQKAPRHPGSAPGMPDWVLQDAYSHEVGDSGFWAGSETLPEAAFYCYLYPEPEGYKTGIPAPAEAYYHQTMGEYILPYAAVQQAEDPEAKLLEFLDSTYQIGADLGKWDSDLYKIV